MNAAHPSAELVARISTVRPGVSAYSERTPLVRFDAGSQLAGAEILLKCEHLQRTGSFKVRGALAKLLSLDDEQRQRGVITASSGNHGLGVAYALSRLGGRGVVYVPRGASPVKVAAIEALGTQVEYEGTEAGHAEQFARAEAQRLDLFYISPYNDLDVIAGQGTIGAEIVDQVCGDGQLDSSGTNSGRLDTVIVSVGGGGLISGVAAAVKASLPNVRVIGATPANDAAMAASVTAGRVVAVDALPTISDGTAGAVEENAITLGLCSALVDDWVLVAEADIVAALGLVLETEGYPIEGSAAVAVAAALTVGSGLAGNRVAVVSCGGNIAADTLDAVRAARPERGWADRFRNRPAT